MPTVSELHTYLDGKAPFCLQESWDNSGLLVGDPEASVSRVLLTLDITDQVIEEAVASGAQLIVSHHPLIFRPAQRMTLAPDDLVGRKLWALAQAGISAICCHTNLDSVEGGVNTVLAQALGLKEITQLAQAGLDAQARPYGIGRIGTLPQPVETEQLLSAVQAALKPHGIRYVDGHRPIQRVAVGGGACGDLLLNAWRAGCDAFITSDLKYNHFLDAKELGLTLIDAGHFPTEHLILDTVSGWLEKGFPGLELAISRLHEEVISYY